MEWNSATSQILGEYLFRETWLPLIKIDRDQIKTNRARRCNTSKISSKP